MTYYIKTRDGKVFKGKGDNWNQVFRTMPFGSKLYNPYTQRTVIGWNNYKAEMARCQKTKYSKKNKPRPALNERKENSNVRLSKKHIILNY